MTGRQQRLEETVRLSDRIISTQAVRLASSKALASLLLNIVHTDLAQEGTAEEEGGDICLGMRCNMVVLVQCFFLPFAFSFFSASGASTAAAAAAAADAALQYLQGARIRTRDSATLTVFSYAKTIFYSLPNKLAHNEQSHNPPGMSRYLTPEQAGQLSLAVATILQVRRFFPHDLAGSW